MINKRVISTFDVSTRLINGSYPYLFKFNITHIRHDITTQIDTHIFISLNPTDFIKFKSNSLYIWFYILIPIWSNHLLEFNIIQTNKKSSLIHPILLAWLIKIKFTNKNHQTLSRILISNNLKIKYNSSNISWFICFIIIWLKKKFEIWILKESFGCSLYFVLYIIIVYL